MSQRSTSGTVSSPASTGGAGTVFEHSVGAYWLAQLLVGGIPPILVDCSVIELHFQTEHLGWCTDDFLVVGQNGSGATRKLAGQVKRTFTISASDEDCKNTILDFWNDFKNPGVFSPATDRFAIVTQLGTNTLLRHFGSLLDCARAAHDADDFEHRLNTTGFLSSTAVGYCDDVVKIISEAEGRELSRREVFPLLRVLDVLSLDLASGTRQAEAAIKSLLSYTAIPEDKAETGRRTWNELLLVSAEGAPKARSFTKADLPEMVGQHHGPCGFEHPMLTALREHSAVITGGIKSTIGETSHLPRVAIVQQVLTALDESRVVLLSGPAGTGKSAIYLSRKLQERQIGQLPQAAAMHLDDFLDQWLPFTQLSHLRHQVIAFRDAGGAACSKSILPDGCLAIACHLQQVTANRRQAMLGGNTRVVIERLQQVKALARAVHHGDGDGVVECNHRVIGYTLQLLIERENLRPVRVLGPRCFVVNRGNCCLELICTYPSLRQRCRQQLDALGNLRLVPHTSVLLHQRNQFAVRSGTRRTPSIRQQHKREQARDLGIVGQ